MASKFICVVLFIFALATLIFSANHMLEPLFIFLSDNPITGGIRLAIVALLLAVSFRTDLLRPHLKTVANFFGVFLVVFGVISLLSNSLGWALYNYLMPFDSLLLVELGIMFNLAALSSAGKEQKTSYQKTKSYQMQLRNKLS